MQMKEILKNNDFISLQHDLSIWILYRRGKKNSKENI